MKSRHRFIIFLFLVFWAVFISLPRASANPVFVRYEYFINLGYGFLFLVIIPITFLITSLIEFVLYCCLMLRLTNKMRILLKTAFFINLITVPITQLIAYLNNLYLLTNLWKYIIIEAFVILVEFLIFKHEMNSVVERRISKEKMFGTILLANIASFLVGFGLFNFFYLIISNLNNQSIQVDNFFISFLGLILFLTLITCTISITFFFINMKKTNMERQKTPLSVVVC